MNFRGCINWGWVAVIGFVLFIVGGFFVIYIPLAVIIPAVNTRDLQLQNSVRVVCRVDEVVNTTEANDCSCRGCHAPVSSCLQIYVTFLVNNYNTPLKFNQIKALLLPNGQGCSNVPGYCETFLFNHSIVGSEFDCFYSRGNLSKAVVSTVDLERVDVNLTLCKILTGLAGVCCLLGAAMVFCYFRYVTRDRQDGGQQQLELPIHSAG